MQTVKNDNGIKPTRLELEVRVDFAELLLARRQEVASVRARLVRMYRVSPRTADRYIRQARRRLIRASGKSKQEHFEEAYRFYESLIADPGTSIRQKMQAQHRINLLFGLYAPRRLHHGGDQDTPPSKTEAGPVLVTTREEPDWSKATVEELRTVKAIVERISEGDSGAADQPQKPAQGHLRPLQEAERAIPSPLAATVAMTHSGYPCPL